MEYWSEDGRMNLLYVASQAKKDLCGNPWLVRTTTRQGGEWDGCCWAGRSATACAYTRSRNSPTVLLAARKLFVLLGLDVIVPLALLEFVE